VTEPDRPSPFEPERPPPPPPSAGPSEGEPGPAGAPEVEAAPYEAASEKGRVFESAPGGPPPPPPAAGDTTWTTACHLSTLLSFVATPLVGVLAPLGIWYLFRRDDARVERAAKEAFNFQVNVLLWGAVGTLLTLTILLCCLGIPLLVAAVVGNVVLTLFAAVKTSSGEDYRYPLTIRFLD